jgi:hypothetical protein
LAEGCFTSVNSLKTKRNQDSDQKEEIALGMVHHPTDAHTAAITESPVS